MTLLSLPPGYPGGRLGAEIATGSLGLYEADTSNCIVIQIIHYAKIKMLQVSLLKEYGYNICCCT
jgi:hypothetical protein